MPDIENVCRKISADPQFVTKFLIGGFLSFIPIVNILVLGYLYRYGLQVREQGDLVLPEWNGWQRLIIDGLRFLVVLTLFFVMPVALGLLLSIMLALGMGLVGLGVLAYFPMGVALFPIVLALFLSPPLTVGAFQPAEL